MEALDLMQLMRKMEDRVWQTISDEDKVALIFKSRKRKHLQPFVIQEPVHSANDMFLNKISSELRREIVLEIIDKKL